MNFVYLLEVNAQDISLYIYKHSIIQKIEKLEQILAEMSKHFR